MLRLLLPWPTLRATAATALADATAATALADATAAATALADAAAAATALADATRYDSYCPGRCCSCYCPS